MPKWLLITGLSILTWGIALAWLEFNVILMSPLVITVVVVLAVALPAYSLGRYAGLKVYYFDERGPASRLPVTTLAVRPRPRHTGPTRPVVVNRLQGQHSHPTQPMPVVASR